MKCRCNYYSILVGAAHLSKQKSLTTGPAHNLMVANDKLGVLLVCSARVTGRTGPGCLGFNTMEKNISCLLKKLLS